MREHRGWIGWAVLSVGWIVGCSGSDGTTMSVHAGDSGGQAGAAAADSGTGAAGDTATTGGTGGTANGGSAGSGTGAQGGDTGSAAAAGAGAGVDSGGADTGLGGRDAVGGGDVGPAGSAGAGSPGLAGATGNAGTPGVAGGVGQAGGAGAPVGAGGSTNVGGSVSVGGTGPIAGAAGAAGAPNPITITPPVALTDDCYLSLNPGDSLDFAQLTTGSGTGTTQLALVATTEPTVGDLATITGTVVEFAAQAEVPGYHAFEFVAYDATGEDRLMIVIDYTSASPNSPGAAIYTDVDTVSGALGTPVTGPILASSGDIVSTFWDVVNGDRDCCMDSTNGVHCGACIYDAFGLRVSWASMCMTTDRCTDCTGLCVLGYGCLAEDTTESANCVAAGTGTHYLDTLGCVYPALHLNNPYFQDSDDHTVGTVPITIGRQVEFTAPAISDRCGFVAVPYSVAASPPYHDAPVCSSDLVDPSMCQRRYEAGDVDRFNALYIVQPQ